MNLQDVGQVPYAYFLRDSTADLSKLLLLLLRLRPHMTKAHVWENESSWTKYTSSLPNLSVLTILIPDPALQDCFRPEPLHLTASHILTAFQHLKYRTIAEEVQAKCYCGAEAMLSALEGPSLFRDCAVPGNSQVSVHIHLLHTSQYCPSDYLLKDNPTRELRVC